MEINEKIRLLREGLGISQTEFVDKFSKQYKIPSSKVEKFEDENVLIEKKELKFLEDYFGIEPYVLTDPSLDLSKNDVLSEVLNPLAKPYIKDINKGMKIAFYETNLTKNFIIYAIVIFSLLVLSLSGVIITGIFYFKNIKTSGLFVPFFVLALMTTILLFVYFVTIFPKLIKKSQRRGMIVGYASNTFVTIFPKASDSEKRKVLFNYNKFVSVEEINIKPFYSDLVFKFIDLEKEETYTLPMVNDPKTIIQVVDMCRRKYTYKHRR